MNDAKFKQKRENSVTTWHRGKQEQPVKFKRSVIQVQAGKGCAGKRRFPDLMAALAGGIFASEMQDTKEVYTYKCVYCGGYHLTGEMFGPDGAENRWVFDYEKGAQ